MSFSDTVREELNSLFPRSRCCQRAFFNGMLTSAKAQENNISISLRDVSSTESFKYCLQTFCKIEPEITQVNRGFCKMTVLRFNSPSIAKTLSFYDTDDHDLSTFKSNFFKCNHCNSEFVKGMLCASGSVNDPKKEYSLEFIFPTYERAALIREMLYEYGIVGGSSTRRSGYGVYFHNYDAVSDILSIAGANKSVFYMSDAQIEKDIRNHENASTNYVTHNIQKTVAASSEQIRAIEALSASDLLRELDDNLRITATLRIQNTEATLQELGDLHTPQISKSGVRQRLERITKIAKDNGLLD